MDRDELRGRTKQFALRVLKLADVLPNTTSGRVIGNQIVKSGTSVGANYRAACRGRSKAEFNSKLHISLEKIDESAFWLELLIEGKIVKEYDLHPLLNEANELTKIFASSYRTAKNK